MMGTVTAVRGKRTSVGARPRGRPRDEQAAEAILGAVVELLAEHGFSGLTVDAVAARAGVGKATIYRRWDTKEALVLAAISGRGAVPEPPDTGSLQGDLCALYGTIADDIQHEAAGRLLPALAAEAAVNPDMRTRLRAFVKDRRAPTKLVLRRGIDRGELPADTDLDLLIDLLVGPLFYRVVFTGQRITPKVVERSIDIVLRGVGARGEPSP
jgi:AcrR family transcriptional regulator